MEDFSIEFTLTVTDSASHNIRSLQCLAWGTACQNPRIPLQQDPGHAAVLTRPDGGAGWGPLTAHEPRIPNAQLGEVVALMRQLGLPGRMPDVRGREGSMAGSQEIVLELRLDADWGRMSLLLFYAGLEGGDAPVCIQMFTRFFELLGVPHFGRWVDPQYQVIAPMPSAVSDTLLPSTSAAESDKPMTFDTDHVRLSLEAVSPTIPEGLVKAVIGLMQEAAITERESCLQALQAVKADLAYNDGPGIRAINNAFAAIERKQSGE